jgi:hypothetical protein
MIWPVSPWLSTRHGLGGPSPSTPATASRSPRTATTGPGGVPGSDDIDEFSAPEFGHHQLEVSFDADGVPVAIDFDLANGDDEERSMEVTLVR